MKKYFLSLGLIAAAAFTLTNCTQEIVDPDQGAETVGVPFEIVAKSVDTKTTNNGLSTVWAEGDAVNLFHAVAGKTEYVSDGEFKFEGENVFKGTLAGELSEGLLYDWFAIYPYLSKVTTPANTSYGYVTVASSASGKQVQKGNNSMAHIAGANYPLAGVCADCEYEAGVAVEIGMSHLTSLLEVVVTNTIEDPLTVTSVSFTAPDNVVGTYYIDFTGEDVIYTPSGDSYVSKTANLTVTGGEALAQGESAKFYLAVKPFTAAANSKLTLSVNGYAKEVTLPAETAFNAGEIKTLNFNYNKVKVELPALSLPWYEDFSSNDLSKYELTNGTKTQNDQEVVVETKLYESDQLAGGSAPEILIASKGGSLTATVATDDYVGDLVLSFKSNHADYLTISTTSGVVISKVSDTEYTLSVPEGVSTFDITLKNTATSNARVDDIEIAKPRATQTLTFENDMYKLDLNSAEMASFVGQVVSGSKTDVTYSSNNEDVATVDSETGTVTLTGATGTAVITAAALQTDEYKAATALYTIVVSNPEATLTEKTVTYAFGTDAEVGFSTWTSSYTSHTAVYEDATITFESANKQSGTITDCPVTKGKSVTIVMGDNRTLKSVDLTLKQWTTKTQTVTLNYSIDGGATYTSSSTSSTFALSADVPEGTNAIKFTFSSSSNQVGIVSCELTFDVAE